MPTLEQTARRSFPASFAQERMWFLDQLDPHTPTYNIPVAFRLKGSLDFAAFERSVQAVVRRHDALRTTLQANLGTPVQVVHDASVVAVGVRTISQMDPGAQAAAVDRLVIEEVRTPFNLETGPLLRVTVLRLGPAEHVLLLTLHHVVGDGWSLELLLREITTLYTADVGGHKAELPALAAQYGDFSVWQRGWLKGDALEPQLAYWRQQLAGPLAVLTLPADHPRPATARRQGAKHRRVVSRELLETITALSRQERVTPFIVLLAVFQTLLSRYSEQEDIVVGVPFANRANRPGARVQSLIGLFANTLVLRGNLSGNPTCRELLRRDRAVVLGAHAHHDLPFGKLVEDLQPERSLSHVPLFQVMMSAQQSWAQALRLPGIDVTEIPVETGTSKCDLTLLTTESPENISLALEYDADLFEERTIERMGEHFVGLLKEATENPDQRLSELPLLSQAERQQILVEWNETAVAIPDRCIHQQFEQQALQTPDAIAVEHDGAALTYQELDRRANRLAHKLRAMGAGAEVLVGLYLERSLDLVVAILGTLKAGAAYVPLDPGLPAPRLATLIESAGLTILVTRHKHARALEPYRAAVICLDAREALEREPAYAPALAITPANLAYVMFTSGSTGRPKAVAVPHRAVIRLLFGVDYVTLSRETTTLLLAPTNFDASTFELWAPLLHGGRCVLFSGRELGLAELGRALKTHHVNCLWLTSSLFNVVIDEAPEILRDVKQLLTGGEALSVAHVRRALEELPDTVLINGYGPTESTTFACCYRIPRQPSARIATIPIGRPISNTTAYVLDQQRQPVPVGVPGELYIGGDGLARGYLNDPALTRERFVPDVFSGNAGARLYRTADRVRSLTDGTIEFLGRLDTQVKIRGFRVEPGEVEAALRAHPQVREALVLLREDRRDDKRLVAYVVPCEEPGPSMEDLRGFLRARLPEYMVPVAFVSMRGLPLTTNGKVDRALLPPPGADGRDLGSHDEAPHSAAPHSAVEEVLAALWATVLGVERVGLNDNFFDLGGHSLLATQLVARIRQAYGVELPVRCVFEAQTVAGLAQRIAAQQTGGPRAGPLRRVAHHAELPLSCAQERLWFLQRLEPGSALYNVPFALRLHGPLDVPALERSLREILRRHEVLRTTLPAPAGRPLQIRIEPSAFALAVVDLSTRPPAGRDAEARRVAEVEARRPFDLAQDLLLRARLLRLGATDHVLLLSFHHIAVDGWSLQILGRELGALYAAFAGGRASPLAEPPLQYADFGVWQRQWMESDELQQQLTYWESQLRGAPVLLALPSDRPRPPVQRHHGDQQAAAFDPGLARALRELSRQEGVTLFMTLLAAFQVVLSRYSGQNDIVVGTPIASRTHSELEGLIGFFVNTLVLRGDLSGNPTFRDLLGRVRDVTLGAYAHADVPFEKLVERLRPERTLRHSPIFQVLFSLQPAPAFALRDVTVTLDETPTGTAKFDLTLVINDEGNGLRAMLEYDTDLFDPETMSRLLADFQVLLAGIAADPACRLADLAPRSEAARPRAVERSQTAPAIPARVREPLAPQTRAEPARPEPAATSTAPRDEIERRLALIWKSVLEVREVGIHDNFFALGGHSLLAARMFVRIEKEFGTAPPLAMLFQEATIDHLAKTLRGQRLAPAWRCLVPIQPLGVRQPIFFVHGGGGNVLGYRDLATHLGSDQPVYGLQAHGLSGDAEPDVTIEAMAARYIGELRRLRPEGPYHLGGLSLGGVVAFEMAQQLSRQGHDVGLLALFDTWRPGFTASLSTRELCQYKLNYYSQRAMFHLVEFLKPHRATRVLRKSRTVKRRVKTRLWEIGYSTFRRLGHQLPTALYRVNSANYHAISGYVPTVYAGRITLFAAATRSVGEYDDPTLGWNGWASGGIERHVVPGDHVTLLAEPYVTVLAGKLATCLDRSARAAGSDRRRSAS